MFFLQNQIQSNMQSSKMSQNPNISVHNSNQYKMKNSSLKKNEIRASRNKLPPMVVPTKDRLIVSTQSE